jgi:hypothetical protein
MMMSAISTTNNITARIKKKLMAQVHRGLTVKKLLREKNADGRHLADAMGL